ncbi:Esterase EstB [Thalassoglobus neptunius]|uniref:Esterase EstB n=1 Tax=Thalassoglobus neptunius TaxID=1938619 RepID=A0A5C5WAF9_9PLAN|nr:serine hydrolase domain-containing protein [Thalassoglobus neptunius]TWT47049.1 Esterase EstB [Thalassoglobus neptunius]
MPEFDAKFPTTFEVIEQGIEREHHLGVQVYISRNNETLLDEAVGENRIGDPMTSETLSLWLSSGKPLTAAAIMQLVDRSKLDIEQPAASIVPEFAEKGKEALTIRQLLTHTAGLRPVSTGWPQQEWDDILAKICGASLRMNWVPGERAGYDPARSWFVLGEIIRRIDGRGVDQYVREEILEPLGMLDCWMSMPSSIHNAYGLRIGIMYTVLDGDLKATHGHREDYCTSPSPGGSMRGPVCQLGKFYEMLLANGLNSSGERILSEEAVQLMTSRQREGMFDETFQHKLDFGLGVIVNSNRYGADTVPYGFGRYASESSFGHGGAQSSIGLADPGHGLVVAAVANGCPGEEIHNERFRDLNSAIYQDLGLVG